MEARKKMNILFISALEIKEKGAQSIRMTLEGYAKAGHQVFLMTQSKRGGKDYFYESEYISDHKNIHIIKFSLPFSYLASKSAKINRIRNVYLFILMAFLKGIFFARKKDIDLIYGYESQGVIAAKLVSVFCKKPLISRFQGTILWPLLNSSSKKDKKKLRENWYQGFSMKLRSDLMIMTNDGTMGDKVLEYYKVPTDKIRFWMNGVNKNIYQPRYKDFLHEKYKIPEDATILITVHRLTCWKRTERALNALSEVLKKESNVYLVIVGEGERRQELEKVTKDLSIESNVFFAGGVPNKEVGKYLNGADIYLGTYDLSNAGNPLFESMLAGLAVISLKNGSTASFLGDGEAGTLIDNEKEFAIKITSLIKDKAELNKWKKLAKNYSHQNFWTWEERIRAEIKEIESIV